MKLLKPSRRLFIAQALAAPALITSPRAVEAFWQSRDSNYNKNVVAAGSTPIAFVDGVTTPSSSGIAVTSAAINSAGANFLVAITSDFGGGIQGTVSDSKSNSWTARTAFVDGSTLSRVQLSYSFASSVGSGHTVSYTGTQPLIGFAAFSNVNASPFAADIGTSGSSVSPAGGSITPAANNGLVISAFCGLTALPITIDSSFNVVGSASASSVNNFAGGMAYIIQTTAGAANPTWTVRDSNPWAATNAVFKN